MNIPANDFIATQCLYTLVLNNPQVKLTNSLGELQPKEAVAIVKAAYDLAEIMGGESLSRRVTTEQEKVSNSPHAELLIKELQTKIEWHRKNTNDPNNLSLPTMVALNEVKNAIEKVIKQSL